MNQVHRLTLLAFCLAVFGCEESKLEVRNEDTGRDARSTDATNGNDTRAQDVEPNDRGTDVAAQPDAMADAEPPDAQRPPTDAEQGEGTDDG